MACICKRRDKWILDYRDQHGVRRWETTNGTRKEAEHLLAQRLQEIGKGEFQSQRDQMTFDELSEAYKSGHVAVNVRENTRRDYERNIRLYLVPYFTGVKVRTITPEMIEAFRRHLLEKEIRIKRGEKEIVKKGVGRRTINKCHTLLSAMLRYALRYRWLSYNPAAEVRKLRAESEQHERPADENILSPSEVRKLLENAGDQWRPILLMAVSTGMRQGELLGLQWGDIDWTAKQVHVRRQYNSGRFSDLKTKFSRRKIGLPDELIHELKKWKLRCPKGEHDLMFPNGAGNPENHGNLLRRGFYPALRHAGLRHIRFHDLRHTFASFLIAKNVHPKRIQALLGHSTIKITMDVYGHLMNEDDNDAAEKVADLVFGSDPAASGSKMVATDEKVDREMSQVLEKMVAGVGIEPTTRGFSVRCSTN
jgi:integrase